MEILTSPSHATRSASMNVDQSPFPDFSPLLEFRPFSPTMDDTNPTLSPIEYTSVGYENTVSSSEMGSDYLGPSTTLASTLSDSSHATPTFGTFDMSTAGAPLNRQRIQSAHHKQCLQGGSPEQCLQCASAEDAHSSHPAED